MELTREQLASMIDHTNLKAFATRDDMRRLCEEARACGFKSVAINGCQVPVCRELLADSEVQMDATVGFPLGQTSVAMKVAEAREILEGGCGEFDYVLNVGRVREGDYDYIEDEMRQLVAVAREAGAGCKVILETCYLTNEQIERVCEVARRVRPDFVKTSTGFGSGGATVEHVRLMKQTVGDDVQVKASGGIRDLAGALAMIEAGATRLGTSAGVSILSELSAE
ncbi:MAG TPA: deoxyribose-phosphate aldolase [Candidatus Olsenella pullistercoris]|uniref:Deoxyribose-phosphate aldolase n=1 Tax=Candidatus Olsenella pullistercoris TaxID=2838712 RepID=A0A9D2EXB7_9ACTN|nr:deoxyribose-phosphate aldolase [Candidatus Olsenella pullistercoris]